MTDIEGSTRLFRSLGDSYRSILEDHNRLVQGALERWGGVILRTEGDSFFAAFGDASDAVAGCVAAQLALAGHPWPHGEPVWVRMGLHTGSAEPVDGDYVSLEVHQVARICSAAHGGQTLTSEATARAIEQPLGGITLNDVGRYQLRGFEEPARLYQVDHPHLSGEFAPVRAPAALAHNIPILRTAFVGRAEERSNIAELLSITGVATIVGPGGVGKTRLSMQIALDTASVYPDGAWFVELGNLADGSRIAHAVAAILGVSEQPSTGIDQLLSKALAGKRMLLVFDNCEHVITDAAVFVERLVQSFPQIAVLATSREPLGVDGEAVWRLGALPVADPEHLPALEHLATIDAVRLFVDRAALVQQGFVLEEQNAWVVATIVAHLEGIPLAIELGAAALRDLGVEEVQQALDDRFALLIRGRRTAPARHQTLWATLEWGYQLLREPERALLRRLSVFAPGWTTEVAADVCSGDPIDKVEVPALIDRLEQASFVAADPRAVGNHLLLESVREFAAVKLREAEDEDLYVHRSVGAYLAIAEDAEENFGRAGQHGVGRALAASHDNLRKAIATCTARSGETERGLRLATALAPFWAAQGHWTEGIDRLTRLVDGDRGASPGDAVQARALNALANLLLMRGDFDEAERRFTAALTQKQFEGAAAIRASTTAGLGFVAFRRSRLDEAERLWADALAFARAAGDDRIAAGVLRSLAIAAGSRLDQIRTGALLDEAIALARSARDDQLLRLLLNSAGELYLVTGEYERSRQQYDRAIALADALGDVAARPALLVDLGWISYLQGDPATADRLATEASLLAVESRNRRLLAAAARLRGEAAGMRGDFISAAEHLDAALVAARELGAPAEIAAVLCSQACLAVDVAEPLSARHIVEEMLALKPLLHGMRRATHHWVLGEAARLVGELDVARGEFDQELALARTATATRHQSYALRGLGDVAWSVGDAAAALTHQREALQIRLRLNDAAGIADSLDAIASVVATESPASAAELLTVASSIRSEIQVPVPPRQRGELMQVRDAVVAATGPLVSAEVQDRPATIQRALEITGISAARTV